MNKTIFRVFEVRAKAGKADQLKEKLSDTSIKVVKGMPGNQGYFFGKNLSTDEQDLVFISLWEDMESVKAHFGKDWEQSYLPEGYEEIIESCSIKHIEFDGILDIS